MSPDYKTGIIAVILSGKVKKKSKGNYLHIPILIAEFCRPAVVAPDYYTKGSAELVLVYITSQLFLDPIEGFEPTPPTYEIGILPIKLNRIVQILCRELNPSYFLTKEV